MFSKYVDCLPITIENVSARKNAKTKRSGIEKVSHSGGESYFLVRKRGSFMLNL